MRPIAFRARPSPPPQAGLAGPDVISRGGTKLTALTLGANVWIARRVRAMLNYGWNQTAGSSLFLTSLSDSTVHELSLRLGMNL